MIADYLTEMIPSYLLVYAAQAKMQKSATKYPSILKAPSLLKKIVMKAMLRIENAITDLHLWRELRNRVAASIYCNILEKKKYNQSELYDACDVDQPTACNTQGAGSFLKMLLLL